MRTYIYIYIVMPKGILNWRGRVIEIARELYTEGDDWGVVVAVLLPVTQLCGSIGTGFTFLFASRDPFINPLDFMRTTPGEDFGVSFRHGSVYSVPVSIEAVL
jgi:hypothetical protein